ncbi:MAG TPA: acetyl-CoA C-acetyltransferase [Dongiaceae bacterium]|nr:acetyl-CoA C-acetyltransferase [Dongiaceae bacterium]
MMRRPVYVVDGSRSPFLKARGKPGPFTPVDLAVGCGRPLLARLGLPPDAFDDVIFGCVNPIADEVNPGRVAGLRLGLDEGTPGWTVQRNCGSGMQSIDAAFRAIESGTSDLVLAGGTEALSYAPLIFGYEAASWFGRLNGARSLGARLAAFAAFRPRFMKPVIGLVHGLTDPIVELNMGQTAEILAFLFDVSRAKADQYAVESHRRLADASANGRLGEIEPLFDRQGATYDHDDGVRPDSTPETLAKLPPVFEKPFGKVTAGNSSQITDGAAIVVLGSEKAVERHKLKPLARIVDSHWAALDPSIMGLGPTLASTPLLVKHGFELGDIDLWELNEAFAAQVLACVKAWADDGYCRSVLGLDSALGAIDRERLNVDGGAISLGHPVGCSGARIVLHLVNALRQRDRKRGIATECIGGGQGGAMLIETV